MQRAPKLQCQQLGKPPIALQQTPTIGFMRSDHECISATDLDTGLPPAVYLPERALFRSQNSVNVSIPDSQTQESAHLKTQTHVQVQP